MKKRKHASNWIVFLSFSAVVGVFVALIVWLYLKIANVGVTVIWETIPDHFYRINETAYTIILCLAGGLVLGIFHHFCGPYPEKMGKVIRDARKTRSFPYGKLPMILVASLLPLLFGGAVGPEAGLVSLLVGLCFWVKDQFAMQRQNMMSVLEDFPDVSRGAVFRYMVKGLFTRADKIHYNKEDLVWKRSEAVSAGIICGVSALVVYNLCNFLLGAAIYVPHLEATKMSAVSRFYAIPLIGIGFGAGYIYLILHRVCAFLFGKMEAKHLGVLNAVLGGAILGIVGSYLPMSMFSGGNGIQAMAYDYLKYTPYMLIFIGLVKLFLTNVCIESGWRGGQFFPILFSGLSIGYGFAVLLGINQIFAVVIVSTALMATVFQQPVGAVILSLIFFPWQDIGWMLLAGFAAGCIPQPAALRMNPENEGFVKSILRWKKQKRIFVSGKEQE